MNKIMKTVLLLAVIILANGCCSYVVYEGSKKRVAERKALAMGDEAAIRAVRLGSDGVGIGIDVTKIESLSERPLLQTGAAFIDALLIYGTYEGVNSLDDDDDRDGGSGTTVNLKDSSHNTINIVNGDNNDSNNDDNKASHGGESNLGSE